MDDREDAPPEPGGAGSASITPLQLGPVDLVVVAVPDDASTPELTAAERDVARLVLEGLTDREIARRRGSSPRTIANQLRAIYTKLGITSRFELAARLGRS